MTAWVSASLVLALTDALILVWAAAQQASFANLYVPAVLGLGFEAVGFTVARGAARPSWWRPYPGRCRKSSCR